MEIVLIGERLASRSFNGANKALPVLASCLANAGFDKVEQLDLERPDISIDQALKAIETADLVLICGAMSPQWGELDETLTKIGRRLDAAGRRPPVIVGGYAVKNAQDILREQPVITAFFDGEGEDGIVAIAAAVAEGTFDQQLSSIRGLCYLDADGRYRHSIAPRVTDISSADQHFGFVHVPERHNMDIFMRGDRQLKTAQLYTQRGCPWVCGFCNKSEEGGRVARLHEESLRQQLRCLKSEGYDAVYVDVDTFTVNIDASRREAQIFHEEGFVWGSNTRIDRIDLNLMKEFVDLDCKYMFCGVEHIDAGVSLAAGKFNGSLQRQLDAAHAYSANVLKVYQGMSAANLPSSFFMILGLPKAILKEDATQIDSYRATTMEEDVACVRFGILDCDPDYFNFNMLRFMPGTMAADRPGHTPYSCVRPSGEKPITAGFFLPRLRNSADYKIAENHGIYRMCESIGPNQPTTTAAEPERIYRTVSEAMKCINEKIERGGKPTKLFIDEDILDAGLVKVADDGRYAMADLKDFESLNAYI